MAKDLSTIPQLNPMFWKKLGDEIAEKIRVHTTKEGTDVYGRRFRTYSPEYAKAKKEGKFKRQSSREVSRPDLQLTGDMMRNLQVRGATPYGVTVGWSGTNAEKVEGNAKLGRSITKDRKPIADKVWKHAERMLDKQLDKNLKAVAKTTTITIG